KFASRCQYSSWVADTLAELSADTRSVVLYSVPIEVIHNFAWPNSHRFENFLTHQERLISTISGNPRIDTFQLGDPTDLQRKGLVCAGPEGHGVTNEEHVNLSA